MFSTIFNKKKSLIAYFYKTCAYVRFCVVAKTNICSQIEWAKILFAFTHQKVYLKKSLSLTVKPCLPYTLPYHVHCITCRGSMDCFTRTICIALRRFDFFFHYVSKILQPHSPEPETKIIYLCALMCCVWIGSDSIFFFLIEIIFVWICCWWIVDSHRVCKVADSCWALHFL